MKRYYLAVDIGTTNWKAAVFDEGGAMVSIARTPTVTYQDESGNSCYCAQEIWNAVSELCRSAQAQAGVRVAAVSVASVAEAVVAVDRQGNVQGDVITWFDRRSFRQAERLKDELGAEYLYSVTGLDVNPIFSLPKILWIRENQPEVYEKTWKWLQIADYILFRLSGKAVTDYTLASRTLVFDVAKNQWSDEILNAVDVPKDMLPDVLESGTVLGHVTAQAAQETGLPADAKVVVGGNDHPCGSVAAGILGAKKILDSSGTAESFILVSSKDAPPPMRFGGQRTCRFLEKDRFALWGGIVCSGRSFDCAYDMLAAGLRQGPGPDYERVLPAVLEEKGMEKGILFYPHLRGAGAPYWEPRSCGSFVGLRDSHTPAMMLKSVMEGLSMQARMIVEMEEKFAGFQAERLCVIGGSSRNVQWQTIKANVLQKEIELCCEPEAVAQGAAMLAAIGDGVYAGISETAQVLAANNRVIQPDERMKAVYDPLYELFQQGYDAMEAFNKMLFEYQQEGTVCRK